MDDLLRTRLEPVIISGGGGRFNAGAEMARAGSKSSASSHTSQPLLPQTDNTIPPSKDSQAKVEGRDSGKTEKISRGLPRDFLQRSQTTERRTVIPELQSAPVTEMILSRRSAECM
jgi:hypothetical protein